MTADDVIVVWNGQTGSDFAIGCGSALTPIVEHVYDGTGTYQGLSRTSYPQLKSYVKGNTTAYAAGTNDLTEMDMLLCYQTPDERNGSTPNLLIGSYGVQRAYWNSLENLRRFPSIVSDGGNLNSLSFSGMKIMIDPDCPPGSLWFLDTSSFMWHQWKEMGWFDTDGRILVRVSGKTELEGTYIAFTQLACENPAANACLRDITTTENNISY
jgi:hypothetical protein